MTDTTGYEKMRRGELYEAPDWHLIELQVEAKKKLDRLNAVPSWDMPNRTAMLRDQLGSFGESFVLSPVTWEYGKHIHIGDGVFINFECIFLDGAEVAHRRRHGGRAARACSSPPATRSIRPSANAATPRPASSSARSAINKPITVGKDCWIGAGAIIVGGVTIGDGTTIGAGSVVTKDIPAGVACRGQPLPRHPPGRRQAA